MHKCVKLRMFWWNHHLIQDNPYVFFPEFLTGYQHHAYPLTCLTLQLPFFKTRLKQLEALGHPNMLNSCLTPNRFVLCFFYSPFSSGAKGRCGNHSSDFHSSWSALLTITPNQMLPLPLTVCHQKCLSSPGEYHQFMVNFPRFLSLPEWLEN